MSTESLEFKRDGKWSVGWFASPGGVCVVQIRQKAAGDVEVYANAEGMQPVQIGHVDNFKHRDVIFQVEVPEGLSVMLKSFGEVECAKIVVEESE